MPRLWPVLLTTHPRDTAWSLGERITTRLRWLDDPQLPAHLLIHRAAARASPLLDADGRPWAQLIRAGGLRALREHAHQGGGVTLDGCLGYDAYVQLVAKLPATTGVVRRVRVVQELHERGTDGWIRRPGRVRLADVPDAGPERLQDEPPTTEGGDVRFLSPEQYFHLCREMLPAWEWQVRGFLVTLEVGGPS